MKLLTVALLSLSFAACGSGDAIDFELDVDPNISTTTELAERLGTIVVVLDSDEGLYPPGSEATEGDLQIKNTDSDPALELVHTIPIADAKLPTFRLDRGGLSVNAVDIRVIGLERDTSTPIAEVDAPGFVSGLRSGWAAFTSAIAVAITAVGFLLPFGLVLVLVAVPLIGIAIRQSRRRKRPAPAASEPAQEPSGTSPAGD